MYSSAVVVIVNARRRYRLKILVLELKCRIGRFTEIAKAL
jgi:hypothetical protein